MLLQLVISTGPNGSVVPSLPGGTAYSIGSSPQYSSVSVLRNGTITSFGLDSFFSTQYWHTSTDVTVGDGYWVRFTRITGGSTYYNGAAVNTWHQLSATRSISHDCPEGYGEEGTYTIEIASDSGGVTIVSSSAAGAYTVDCDSV